MATFFISYTQEDYRGSRDQSHLSEFLEKFEAVLRSRSEKSGKAVVFIDRNIAAGDNWSQNIEEALRTCEIFFSVESPAYFQRPFCDKEWNAFRQRLAEYALTRKEQKLPPMHIRIPWVPISGRARALLPPEAETIQDARNSLGVHAESGLEPLFRGNKVAEYQDVLTKLVTSAMEARDNHVLPPAPDFNFSHVKRTFPFLLQNQSAIGKERAVGMGSKFLRLGIIAGSREEIAHLRGEVVDSYGDQSFEWQPFYPAVPKGIGPLVQEIAGAEGVASGYLQVEGDLRVQLGDAEKDGVIVIFLVDPWVLEPQFENWRSWLSHYDNMHYLTSCLLIPWPSDPQTRASKDRLLGEIRHVLRTAATREPRSFREAIKSRKGLESEVLKAIARARKNIVKNREVARKLPGSDVDLPGISGPG
jgi:FxsC-like protein